MILKHIFSGPSGLLAGVHSPTIVVFGGICSEALTPGIKNGNWPFLQVISNMNFNMLHKDDAAQLPHDEKELGESMKKAKAYLEKVAEGLRSKGINVNTMVTKGSAAEEIVKAAHATDAHLIAMSTHGRNGIVRWAIGSVTDQVIRLEGKIPVLAVRASKKQDRSPVLTMESLQSLVKHS